MAGELTARGRKKGVLDAAAPKIEAREKVTPSDVSTQDGEVSGADAPFERPTAGTSEWGAAAEIPDWVIDLIALGPTGIEGLAAVWFGGQVDGTQSAEEILGAGASAGDTTAAVRLALLMVGYEIWAAGVVGTEVVGAKDVPDEIPDWLAKIWGPVGVTIPEMKAALRSDAGWAIVQKLAARLLGDAGLSPVERLSVGVSAVGILSCFKDYSRITREYIASSFGVDYYTPPVGGKTTTPEQERDTPAPRHELPSLPKGLNWPRHDYVKGKVPEFGKWGGLELYLKKVWQPLVPHIDMPTLRENYPRLGEAIDRKRPELLLKGVDLPPVEKEVTNKIAASIPKKGDRPYRVEKALQMRAYRARRKLRVLVT